MPLSRHLTKWRRAFRPRAFAALFALTLLFCLRVGAALAQQPAEDGSPASGSSGVAQTGAADAEGARGGWVVAAFTGGAATRASRLSVSQPALGNRLTFDGVRFDGRSFEPPLYYGLRGGYFLRRRPGIGFEAEFTHLKVFSDPQQIVSATGTRRGRPLDAQIPLGQIVQQYSISHGVNLLLFNVAARRRVGVSGERPAGLAVFTARAGAGPTIPHTESSVEGLRQEQYEWGRPAWQAAGGAEFKLWRGLHALGEYKFTRTRQRGRVAGGEARSLLRTHHGVFGLSYHF
jgi:lipid A oxidase